MANPRALNHPLVSGIGAIALALVTGSGQAAPGALSQVPLFTSTSAKPNVILVMDDSGSMDAEVLFPNNDGALWWNTSSNTFVGVDDENGTAQAGRLNFNLSGSANATWKKFIYLFPNGTGTNHGGRAYGDSTHHHFAIPPIGPFAFARSAEYNKSYYDPAVTYDPWPSYGSVTFGNIDPINAPADPMHTAIGDRFFDLTQHIQNNSTNWQFKVYPGMVIPQGTTVRAGSWTALGADNAIAGPGQLGIRYYPATYYSKITTGSYTVFNGATPISGNCNSPDASHYTYYSQSPGNFTSAQAEALGPDGACLNETMILSTDAEMQNFANWFSYYRKRHQSLRNGIGGAFSDITGVRAGMFTINNRVGVTMNDMDTASATFLNSVYAIDGNSGGTPNRHALGHAGTQFMRTDANAPIEYSCQRNFALQFTDGYSTLDGPTVPASESDVGEGAPYADNFSDTLADIAMQYYNKNLRTDLTSGKVPADSGCSVDSPDPVLDCNTDPHMNTMTIGLGASGTVFGNTHFNVADAHATAPTWPDVNTARDPRQIDDLYHAAVNGRGEMYSADTPAQLRDELSSALSNIMARIGAAAAVTFNTSELNANSELYLGLFNSSNWSGDLLAFRLTAFGDILPAKLWSAAELLDLRSAASRTIISYERDTSSGTSSYDGIGFSWGNLNAVQKADLRTNVSGGTDPAAIGQARLNFLRGSRTDEGTGHGFRQRSSVLGDIVHSSSVFVGSPDLGISDDADFGVDGNRYSDYQAGAAGGRAKIIYVGANDGMLHAILAEDSSPATFSGLSAGDEVLAYIPGNLFSNAVGGGLHALTEPSYSHRYFVDAPPTVSDAYVKVTSSGSADWRTILVGSQRGGGRGLFALDVTDPGAFSESNADDLVLWEFTNEDDADLGHTYSQPVITMMENNRWAAIFGNGYEDTGVGAPQLFVVYLDGGLDGVWTLNTDYFKITTGAGSSGDRNGLGQVAVVDIDGNGKADRAYGGDLRGNLWAFDLSDTTPTNWAVAYRTGSTKKPLFNATVSGVPQSITGEPMIAFHPSVPDAGSNEPNVMVFFGTGQYLVDSDKTSTGQQSFYGVWDHGDGDLSRGDLVQQTFESGYPAGMRVMTDNPVNYAGPGSKKDGWHIDLPASRERVVVSPAVRNDVVFFNTMIPSIDPCEYGGTGWRMAVSLQNGGPPEEAPFDVNGDGKVDEDDMVSIDGGTTETSVSGEQFEFIGLPADSAFLGDKQYTAGSKTTSGSEIDVEELKALDSPYTGRLSWEELLNE